MCIRASEIVNSNTPCAEEDHIGRNVVYNILKVLEVCPEISAACLDYNSLLCSTLCAVIAHNKLVIRISQTILGLRYGTCMCRHS